MEESTTPVEQAPAQPAPAPVTSKKQLPVRAFIIAGIIILVLGVLAALLLIRIDGFTLAERVTAQTELRGIMVADRSFESVVPQSFGLMNLMPHEVAGVTGTIGDYAAGGNAEVAVVRLAETGASEVVLLGVEPRVLASGSAAKASVAVSDDGAFVAYAARTDGAAAFAPYKSMWTVHLIEVESGRDIELGTGFDPEFFTRDGVSYLLFTTADSIVVNSLADTASITGFITPFELSDAIDHTARISPNGTYLALKDPSTRQYTIYSVYRVATGMPLGLEPHAFPTMRYTDIIFTSGAAYGIDNLTQGSASVWKIELGEAAAETKRYTFTTEYPNRFIR